MGSSGLTLPPELQTLHVDLSESDDPAECANNAYTNSATKEPDIAITNPSCANQNDDLNGGFSFSQYYTPLQNIPLSLDALICIGLVESIVGSAAMVKGILSAEAHPEAVEDADKPFFIEGTVYTPDGTLAGRIVDVWGSVDSPIYTIQLTTNNHLQRGDKIMVDRTAVTRAKADLGKSDTSDD